MDEQKLVFKQFDQAGGAWMALVLEELRQLNRGIQQILAQINTSSTLDKLPAKERVEAKFSQPLADILRERADKTVREVASELGVSKSLVAQWRKEMGVKKPCPM